MRPSRISRAATNRAVLLAIANAEALRRHDHRRVDADDVAARRDERPARVAGIERGIGLDDVVHQPAGLRPQRSAEGADDAGRHRVVEAVRVADGDGHLSDAHVARIAERRPWQRAGVRLMRMHGQVGVAVGANQVGPHAIGRRAVSPSIGPALATTWLLVRMRPSGVNSTPEPPPRPPRTFTTAGPTVSTAWVTAREYASRSSSSFGERNHPSIVRTPAARRITRSGSRWSLVAAGYHVTS